MFHYQEYVTASFLPVAPGEGKEPIHGNVLVDSPPGAFG
jgi:hypothetical protein